MKPRRIAVEEAFVTEDIAREWNAVRPGVEARIHSTNAERIFRLNSR